MTRNTLRIRRPQLVHTLLYLHALAGRCERFALEPSNVVFLSTSREEEDDDDDEENAAANSSAFKIGYFDVVSNSFLSFLLLIFAQKIVSIVSIFGVSKRFGQIETFSSESTTYSISSSPGL
jgi:hypothetical protein